MKEYLYRSKDDRVQRMKDRRALLWRLEEEEEEQRMIRKKSSLEISPSDDPQEQHADAVAKKVISGEDASGLIKSQPAFSNSIQTKSETEAPPVTDQFQSNLSNSKGGGQNLDVNTQQEMGNKMGADLSDVKIHTGSNAHEMSESINAKAFTHGNDIYFKQGNFNTTTTEGKSLLAHELTHTLQQQGDTSISLKIQRAADEVKVYTVSASDTLEEIIRQSGVSKMELLQMNKFLLGRAGAQVRENDELKLPVTSRIGERKETETPKKEEGSFMDAKTPVPPQENAPSFENDSEVNDNGTSTDIPEILTYIENAILVVETPKGKQWKDKAWTKVREDKLLSENRSETFIWRQRWLDPPDSGKVKTKDVLFVYNKMPNAQWVNRNITFDLYTLSKFRKILINEDTKDPAVIEKQMGYESLLYTVVARKSFQVKEFAELVKLVQQKLFAGKSAYTGIYDGKTKKAVDDKYIQLIQADHKPVQGTAIDPVKDSKLINDYITRFSVNPLEVHDPFGDGYISKERAEQDLVNAGFPGYAGVKEPQYRLPTEQEWDAYGKTHPSTGTGVQQPVTPVKTVLTSENGRIWDEIDKDVKVNYKRYLDDKYIDAMHAIYLARVKKAEGALYTRMDDDILWNTLNHFKEVAKEIDTGNKKEAYIKYLTAAVKKDYPGYEVGHLLFLNNVIYQKYVNPMDDIYGQDAIVQAVEQLKQEYLVKSGAEGKQRFIDEQAAAAGKTPIGNSGGRNLYAPKDVEAINGAYHDAMDKIGYSYLSKEEIEVADLNKQIKTLSEGPQTEESKKRIDLLKASVKLKRVGFSGKELFDYTTGNFAGRREAASESASTNAEIQQMVVSYEKTDHGTLTRLRDDLFFRMESFYLNVLVKGLQFNAPEVIKRPDKDHIVVKDLRDRTKTITVPFQDPKDRPLLAGFAAGQDNDDARSEQSRAYFRNLQKLFIAVNKALYLNEDISGIDRGAGTFFQNVWGSLGEALGANINTYPQMMVDSYVTALTQNGVYVSPEQKGRFHKQAEDELAAASGETIVFICKLIFVAIVTKNVSGAVGLTQRLDKLRLLFSKAGPGGRLLFSMLENTARDAFVFKVAGGSAAGGAGMGLTNSLLPLNFISPKLGVVFNFLSKTAVGAAGLTVGTFVGQFFEVAANNGFDLSAAYKDTFGKDAKEFKHKLLVTYLMSLAIASASNLLTIKALRNELEKYKDDPDIADTLSKTQGEYDASQDLQNQQKGGSQTSQQPYVKSTGKGIAAVGERAILGDSEYFRTPEGYFKRTGEKTTGISRAEYESALASSKMSSQPGSMESESGGFGTKKGQAKNAQTELNGTVSMEQHSDYAKTITGSNELGRRLAEKATKNLAASGQQGQVIFKEIKYNKSGNAGVSVVEIVDAQGNYLRTEIQLVLVNGMEYRTLLHEKGHLEQLEQLIDSGTGIRNLPHEFKWEQVKQSGAKVTKDISSFSGKKLSDVKANEFTHADDAVTEYHQRLKDFIDAKKKLNAAGRAGDPVALKELADGVEYYKKQYQKNATPAAKEKLKVLNDQIPELERQYKELNEKTVNSEVKPELKTEEKSETKTEANTSQAFYKETDVEGFTIVYKNGRTFRTKLGVYQEKIDGKWKDMLPKDFTDAVPEKLEDIPEKKGNLEEDQVGVYTTTISWAIHKNIPVRPFGKGFWGKRITQGDARVNAYEKKINPNDESYYLPNKKGEYVQFENIAGDILEDGKLVQKKKTVYHVYDVPYAQNKILAEAKRQADAAEFNGLSVEWKVSDQEAVSQMKRFFAEHKININVVFYPE
jgi:LysM repeat protein